MSTLKEVAVKLWFYKLTNYHTVLLAGAGITRDEVEDCLKEGLGPQEIKAKLFKVIDSLNSLESYASKAVKKTAQIQSKMTQALS